MWKGLRIMQNYIALASNYCFFIMPDTITYLQERAVMSATISPRLYIINQFHRGEREVFFNLIIKNYEK